MRAKQHQHYPDRWTQNYCTYVSGVDCRHLLMRASCLLLSSTALLSRFWYLERAALEDTKPRQFGGMRKAHRGMHCSAVPRWCQSHTYMYVHTCYMQMYSILQASSVLEMVLIHRQHACTNIPTHLTDSSNCSFSLLNWALLSLSFSIFSTQILILNSLEHITQLLCTAASAAHNSGGTVHRSHMYVCM